MLKLSERGKILKGEGLPVLSKRIKTMEADENKIYRFLGVEQSDGIKMKQVYKRMKEEISRKMNIITRIELYDNTKVIAVAAYH